MYISLKYQTVFSLLLSFAIATRVTANTPCSTAALVLGTRCYEEFQPQLTVGSDGEHSQSFFYPVPAGWAYLSHDEWTIGEYGENSWAPSFVAAGQRSSFHIEEKIATRQLHEMKSKLELAIQGVGVNVDRQRSTLQEIDRHLQYDRQIESNVDAFGGTIWVKHKCLTWAPLGGFCLDSSGGHLHKGIRIHRIYVGTKDEKFHLVEQARSLIESPPSNGGSAAACNTTYVRDASKWRNRAAPIAIKNNSSTPKTIAVYHPSNSPTTTPFNTAVIQPGAYIWVFGSDYNLGEDWGISTGDGCIRALGDVGRYTNAPDGHAMLYIEVN